MPALPVRWLARHPNSVLVHPHKATHGQLGGKGIRTKLLIDLKLNRQPMAIPSKSSLDVMSSLCCVACYHVLHVVGMSLEHPRRRIEITRFASSEQNT